MICQVCGVEAPTKHVAFYQNVGALVVRFSKSIDGRLCKSCIHKNFWSMTGTTLVVGWWGTISFILTPFMLLNNIGRYIFCLGMPSVPPGATAPELTEEAIEKITPHAGELIDSINSGVSLSSAAAHTAEITGTTPGQVMLYVQALIRAQQRQ
jgi:hypothetical protein